MKMKMFDGYEYMDGGVCAAEGFFANGINSGIDPVKEKNDLGMIFSDSPCATAAVYTQNKVKGAPIAVTKKHLKETGGISRAVVVNSKNANTCNADGEKTAEEASRIAAAKLGIKTEEVIVASTGVIGVPLPIEPFRLHMEELAAGLSRNGNEKAAAAIMTTDTVKKEVAVKFKIGEKECRLGGMAKGSGMIHPNMATTLNFITTDANVSAKMLQNALSDVVKVTYNCLIIDGDTSTNDMVCVMANGKAGNVEIDAEGKEYEIFKKALYIVMMNMTRMLAADGEGASKLLECRVCGAPNADAATAVAKSVVRSPLVKCAMFGEDANCGRIYCAIGYADADFDVSKAKVSLSSEYGEVDVFENGAAIAYSEEDATQILKSDEIHIKIDLCQGASFARAWGCDLTYDYVKINGDYRS